MKHNLYISKDITIVVVNRIMETAFKIDPNQIYTTGEVSEILTISKMSVCRIIKEKKLVAYKFGKRSFRVSGSDLIDYLNRIISEVK